MQLRNKGDFVMNGRRLLLDTNAIVYLLAGNKEIGDILKSAEWVGISVISQIEFLAFSDLDKRDEQLFIEFLKRVEVIGLPAIDDRFINRIVYLSYVFKRFEMLKLGWLIIMKGWQIPKI